MKTNKKSKKAVTASIISLLLLVAMAGGNIAAYQNRNQITAYLCGTGVRDDSQEAQAAREQGNALAATVSEEGSVLLKNQNKVLPLKNNKVNVFGWSGSNSGFMPQGTGSGTGSRNDLVTFLGGLREAGIEYNTKLEQAYNNLGWSRSEGNAFWIEARDEKYDDMYGVREAPESFYTDELMQDAREYSDTAIIVLGRFMGEGNDFSKQQFIKNGEDDTTRKLQELSVREEYMINLVKENFENVIVVVNCSNPMEMGFADDEGIDAVLHMGYPGTRGTIGLARLLKGEDEKGDPTNPSGRLADTWAYDLSMAATYATSGKEGVLKYADTNYAYLEYREDIYTGYYWYETADKEGFWDSDYAKQRWGIKNGYEDVVQYPFGYGLSYTTFDWEIDESTVQNNSVLAKEGKIKMTVCVTNTGDVAGKDVVELYYSAPYTKGGIEKAAVKLGAFAKTPVIKPGESAWVELEMAVEDMKSYDCYDENNNGIMGYELEKGDYQISLRTDAHTIKENVDVITTKVAEDIYYEFDSVTGTKVENQFTTYTNPITGASSKINEPFVNKPHSLDGAENAGGPIAYMTRADFIGSFPAETGAPRNAGDISEIHGEVTPIDDPNVTAEDVPEFGSKSTNWVITDLYGVEYEDPMWDELTSQLTYDEARLLITRGGFGTIAIDSIKLSRTAANDGPSGFNNTVTGGNDLKAVNYPCDTIIAQTWNWFLAYQVGLAIGIEGTAIGCQGWYGPGGNLHRDPMGGRNFEYYSEDPILSGTIGAYHVLGAKEEGVTAYVKHIGTNEDDKYRESRYNWLTEQSMRENYLKPYELIIKIGKANGLMAANTRTGGVRSSSSYAMLTAIVRDEWGFIGCVITDWYTHVPQFDIDEGIRAGTSLVLHNTGEISWLDDSRTDTAKYYIHMRAKDILYHIADTNHYAETAKGLEQGELTGVRVLDDVFAWWIPALIGVDALMVLIMIVWISSSLKKDKKLNGRALRNKKAK